ncbi:MAG: hypothetical protein JXA57_18535 [Armatimonadetes bacterium]|nr:hypothetical protein [Armatimonadota bacterium]
MQPVTTKARNVALAFAGAAVLVLEGHYAGPLDQVVHAYAGNFAASFALYFAVVSATERHAHPRLAAAVVTLIAVTAFEVSDGFHLMANVYDAVDLFANAVGVGFGVGVDVLSVRLVESEDSPGSG